MKTSSAKSKGRRLQQEVVDKFRKKYNFVIDTVPKHHPDNVTPAIMGDSGIDVKLSPLAKTVIPFDVECKNQERVMIWQWIQQCEANSETGRVPLVVFKRNRSEAYVCLKLDDLLKLI